MSIIGWIILGLIAGFIASKIVNSKEKDFFSTSFSALLEGSLVAGYSSTSAERG